MNDSRTLVIIVLDKSNLDLQGVAARVLQAFDAEMQVTVHTAIVSNNHKNVARSQFYAALTARQRQVVQRVVCGLSNKEVAYELSVVSGVVAEYLSEIYTRLDDAEHGKGAQHSNRARLISFFGDFFETAV